MFFDDLIQAFAFENKPVFYTGTKIKQLENGLFQILTSSGSVIYEGEMKNGKKHGEGIEYFDDNQGHVKYVGHYENDKRNGEGQRYVLRNGQPVLIEDGIFKDGNFKKGKKYDDGQLEYDGEVETIENLVNMDRDERHKARKHNQNDKQKDNDKYDDDDERIDNDHYNYYKNKSKNQEYLYHGKGYKSNFIGEFNRGDPESGDVFFDSSAITTDLLRQLSSYTLSNKPVNEKEQDIQKTEDKYKNNHIQMGKMKMNITEDKNGNKKVEHFVEVDKKVGNTTSKYKIYKDKKNEFDDGEIKYDHDARILNKEQYILSKHLQGTWKIPNKKDIVFKSNDNGKTTKYNLTEDMATRIAKYL